MMIDQRLYDEAAAKNVPQIFDIIRPV